MDTAKIFKNGQSQAVRLPRNYRFEGAEVEIKKIGDAVLLTPIIHSWDHLLKSIHMFPEDITFIKDKTEFKEKDLF